MLWLPTKVALIAAAVIGVVLGAHGIYVYFNSVELGAGGNPSDLFLTVGMPSQLDGIILWSTLQGLKSWAVPALVVVGGLAAGWIASVSGGRRRYAGR
jgi:hypothetical protein